MFHCFYYEINKKNLNFWGMIYAYGWPKYTVNRQTSCALSAWWVWPQTSLHNWSWLWSRIACLELVIIIGRVDQINYLEFLATIRSEISIFIIKNKNETVVCESLPLLLTFLRHVMYNLMFLQEDLWRYDLQLSPFNVQTDESSFFTPQCLVSAVKTILKGRLTNDGVHWCYKVLSLHLVTVLWRDTFLFDKTVIYLIGKSSSGRKLLIYFAKTCSVVETFDHNRETFSKFKLSKLNLI